MPKMPDIQKVFVIGSGPIVIGQGCEFDYAGVQACKALREEQCEVVLLNSNPATIMTDPGMADAVYIAPMTIEKCEKIIKIQRPQALLSTVGGQTALNLSLELARRGILKKYGVKLIGASVEAIEMAESRKLFREAMQFIGLETPLARTVYQMQDVFSAKSEITLPVMIRTSFTLGGYGSGIVHSWDELVDLCQRLFANPACKTLELEESLLGWKEFEMEAIRDRNDNCILICSLENFDPMGVHTGDSITVAPTQTLCNKEYQRMREYTFSVLRKIGVDTGGANVQFAVHPETGRMVVIEMNPRVSRSSALASKATGYPIAKVATKLALGYTLDELTNTLVDVQIPASFEPSIDYVVTKLPRFNFEKFARSEGVLTTKMQATGEVMGIGRNFQESLLKAIMSVEKNLVGLKLNNYSVEQILEKLSRSYHDRLFYIADAFRKNIDLEVIYQKTAIDRWFLEKIKELVFLERKLVSNMPKQDLFLLKRNGFSDQFIAQMTQQNEMSIRQQRLQHGIKPVYKQVDGCAAEFPAKSVCLYSTYEIECEAKPTQRKKILIIGSGPNRIGQGIEFDYCSVHAVLASRALGYETIMINSNPEAVSTDYDIVDRLYLEPLTLEHVLNVVEIEQPTGVVTQFGGQTPLNLVEKLAQEKVPLIGTNAQMINLCENRDLFREKVKDLGLRQADNFCVTQLGDWKNYADQIQYPVIVRPSYLLSGSSMQVIANCQEYLSYYDVLAHHKNYFPVLVEHFLENAIEVEVDGICDGTTVFIPGVLEQFELAGIHSGDSACCFPPYRLSLSIQQELIQQSKQLALAFNIIGLFNIQFAIQNENIFIIELNPRSSRTVPFLSKALGISLPQIAMRCLLGESLVTQGYEHAITPDYFAIKKPVFPFDHFGEYPLGPEMRSTGEVMIFKKNLDAQDSLLQPL